MYRILIIGDAHIPDRAYELPRSIEEFIDRERPFDIAVYTGDFTGEEIYEWFKSLGIKSYAVEGNMDYLPLPTYEVFEISGIKFGVIHGDQVFPRGNVKKLTRIAKRLNVSVLLSGHTHSPFIRIYEDVLHVNPGSLTGVWGGGGGSGVPSLILAILWSSEELELQLHELVNDKLELRKLVVLNPMKYFEVIREY